MINVLVTGAEGFVGRVLVRRLLEAGLGGQPVGRLSLMDLAFASPPADPRVRRIVGSVADRGALEAACEPALDVVFHLASVPGGAAERDYELGRSINLEASFGLLEALRSQARPPRLVFASTVAVYGERLPEPASEDTPPAPALTYGAHKLASEILVADATRRGWVQGCSLRIPGVVARPGEGTGMMSAFMSQIFWKLAAGEAITVPVARDSTAWWISVGACVDNLCHAATLDTACLDPGRSYQMPVLHLSMGEVVAALADRFGADRAALVTYAPDPFVQRLFASSPPLDTPKADAIGFRHDGDVHALVARALAP